MTSNTCTACCTWARFYKLEEQGSNSKNGDLVSKNVGLFKNSIPVLRKHLLTCINNWPNTCFLKFLFTFSLVSSPSSSSSSWLEPSQSVLSLSSSLCSITLLTVLVLILGLITVLGGWSPTWAPREWMRERMSEWVSEGVGGWMGGWVGELVGYCFNPLPTSLNRPPKPKWLLT